MFTSEDLGQNSSYRELKAIYYVLLSCVEQLWQKRVKVLTDNQGSARIVSVGSSKVHILSVATSIFDFCFSNGINLTLKHSGFPGRKMRERMSLAESLTRTIGASILRFSASLMLNGVLTHLTALQLITMLSSSGLNRSLPLPDTVRSTPWHRTGAPITTGCVAPLA